MIGIYKITNKNNGKVYIGQTDNLERRLKEHKQYRKPTIDDYINVLGVENFDFEILQECEKDELDYYEQHYIAEYDSQAKGYNIQKGGLNNVSGEGNGRAKLTEQDVIDIRTAYAAHAAPKQLWREKYQDKITLYNFQGIWQGLNWTYIMPEVYTEENKNYYKYEMCKKYYNITPEEVYEYRKYYVNHDRHELYNKYALDHQNDEELLAKNTFIKIITGDVKKNSDYLKYPTYNKKTKTWSNE